MRTSIRFLLMLSLTATACFAVASLIAGIAIFQVERIMQSRHVAPEPFNTPAWADAEIRKWRREDAKR